jgi:hypothetical protein
MSDVQITIIDSADTQVVSSVPGIQGPVGQGFPSGGTANQVLFKQSSTSYDAVWGNVTSAMIGNLEIVDADVSASAAIAGTKVSPNFGSQNIISTGTGTAASFIPTSSTVPTNGVYLSAANSVAVSTNSTGRLFIDSSGRVGIGASSSGNALYVVGTVQINTFSSGEEGLLIRREFGNPINLRLRTFDDPTKDYVIQNNNGVLAIIRNTTEQVRIDSAGRLLVGTSTGRTLGGASSVSGVQVEGTGTTGQGGTLSLVANNTGVLGGTLLLAKSRGTSVGSSTVVQSGDRLGEIYFLGADGSTMDSYGALIRCEVDGTPGTNDMPGRLVFSTTPDGAASPTERLRIDSAGRVGLGSSAPQYLLHLGGDTSGSANGQIALGSVANVPSARIDGYRTDGSFKGQLHFYTTTSAGTQARAVTIDEQQRVGIGTTAPRVRLHVQGGDIAFDTNGGTSSATFDLVSDVTGNNGQDAAPGIAFRAPLGPTQPDRITYAAIWSKKENTIIGSQSGALVLGTNVNYGTGITEKVRIDSVGNLGVGVPSPGTASFGNVIRNKAPAGTGAAGYFAEGSNSDSWFGIYSGTGTADSAALVYPVTGSLRIGSTTGVGVGGFSERLRIDSGGNIGQGGIPFNYAANVRNLQVNGTGYSALTLGTTDATTDEKYWRLIARTAGPDKALQIQVVNDSGGGEATAYTVTRSGSSVSSQSWSTGGSERLRITNDAYIRLAAGTGGIQFNGDTAAANALDDYEEGTWTVTFHDAVSAGNQSATTATGTYTKVGRLVQVQFVVSNINTSGLTAGNQLFFALPFAGLASPFEEYNGACSIAGSSLASTPITTHLVSNSARAYFLVNNTASGSFSGFLISSIASGANGLRVSLTYMA